MICLLHLLMPVYRFQLIFLDLFLLVQVLDVLPLHHIPIEKKNTLITAYAF